EMAAFEHAELLKKSKRSSCQRQVAIWFATKPTEGVILMPVWTKPRCRRGPQGSSAASLIAIEAGIVADTVLHEEARSLLKVDAQP
ncbi:hypothetical protein, partial [Labrys sp. 22185]|uniref:hypothetical protein n=1 Tax=Labrys sp. 22185 TaxID=3453888 RepID=UPI003F84941E